MYRRREGFISQKNSTGICLQKRPWPMAIKYSSHTTEQKFKLICENLSTLYVLASSLLPSVLNDQDVNLMSVFTEQLKKLSPLQIGKCHVKVQAYLTTKKG